jgi:hypothetical protein
LRVAGIGDVSESAAWQSLGGGVADYLSALPLPLHHLLKYSADGGKRDEPAILAVSALPAPAPAQPAAPAVSTQTPY